jgi:hypothetical protein
VIAIVARSKNELQEGKGLLTPPMFERDRKGIEYLNDKIWRNDTTYVNMLRMNKTRFFQFS